MIRDHINARKKKLDDEFDELRSIYQDIQKQLLPWGGQFLYTDRKAAKRKAVQIIDNTAVLALQHLQAGIMAGLTNPSQPWLKLVPPDPGLMRYAPVREWLWYVEQILYALMARSNLYSTLPMLYAEEGGFGTGVIGIFDDPKDVIFTQSFTIGSYRLAQDERGTVNTFLREFPLTVSQLVSQFGLNQVSQTVKDLYARSSYDEVVKDIIHCIEPDTEGRYPYRSVYFESAGPDKSLLRRSGYNQFPMLAPRWSRNANDVMGVGPGHLVRGDAKALQKLNQRKLQGIDKIVHPPMNAPPSMQKKRLSTQYGEINYISTLAQEQGFKPSYQISMPLGDLTAETQDTRLRIRRALYEDLFLMLAQTDRREITAREVEEKHAEKVMMLGPMMQNNDKDLLDPLVNLLFTKASLRNLFPPPPPELEGQDLKVEYISILAQAQRSLGLTAIKDTAGFILTVSQGLPDALDKLNVDDMIDKYADMNLTPPTMIVSNEQANAKRQARAQQQRMEQMQQMAAVAKDAGDATKSLSEATPDGTSVLDKLKQGLAPGQ